MWGVKGAKRMEYPMRARQSPNLCLLIVLLVYLFIDLLTTYYPYLFNILIGFIPYDWRSAEEAVAHQY